jgi:hypothetical protein
MRVIVLFVIFCCRFTALAQQSSDEFHFEAGDLRSRYDPAAWPNPETVLRDLRSPDDNTRLNALHLVGLTDEQARPFDGSGSVVHPRQMELRYAAIGDDATLQAILAAQIDEGSLAFAAVAVPRSRGWERIGAFNCWCKYDNNPLQEFVSVRGSELVLRASGGGTGLYVQQEVHFRIHGNRPRKVISFESVRRSCAPGVPFCTLDNGRFSGNMLVKSREKIGVAGAPENAACTPYQWDEKAFFYRRLAPAAKCPPVPH